MPKMSGARAWASCAAVIFARTLLGTAVVAVLWSVGPMAFGWTSVVIVSGSMEPKLHPGDVAIARPISGKKVHPGQPVLVENPAKPGKLLLHRIIRRNADGSLVTKGDANADEDSDPVPESSVRALPRLLVKYIGLPMYWYGRGEYKRVAAAVAVVVVLGVVATRRVEEEDDEKGDGTEPTPEAGNEDEEEVSA
jgi:signal peptidase I